MNRLLPVVAISFSLLAPLEAQQQQQQRQQSGNQNQRDGGQSNRSTVSFALWKAELPGGSYLVARNAISAVSSQQYILDGVARVTEVNVTTNGNFHPRFYYLEMIENSASDETPGTQIAKETVAAAAKAAAEQADPDAASKVVKNYPSTTHAGTIEFRLPTADAVQKLYESVTRTWLTGQSEVFTLNGTRRLNPGDEIKDANNEQGAGGPGSTGSGTN